MAGFAGRVRAWKTAWRRHDQYGKDGTWDAILAVVLTAAADADRIDWAVSVDSTVNRAHQHATNLPRHTGGTLELQELGCRAR
ncbi:iS5 family ISMt1-like transposase [Mycobacterium kansasii]|uniref:IS5 family ISMt1-like transposase n=1 Tax=Mycobacterium kansasii TaxID=1768 RepID=A0A1V3XYW5_MYCKA|nr:iS5 family ISMt1-like transposase [Mycobacterium kansasii]